MACPRRETVDPNIPGIYHCWSRCVRRAYLCGYDALTRKNFDHRKAWVEERLEELASVFAIDILAYAVMDNHQHLALSTKPQVAREWTKEEVVRRWCRLFPLRRGKNGKPKKLTAKEVNELTKHSSDVDVYRSRLADLSWFMRCLNENIARRANKEDKVTGRFWEGRFKCTRLEDVPSTIACMVYIDLNPIRAGKADTPEESEYTSAFRRIAAAKCKTRGKRKAKRHNPTWLRPIEKIGDENGKPAITLTEYLLILDETGRQLAEGKPGAIPRKARPILERISIQPINWLLLARNFGYFFPRIAGSPDKMHAAAKACRRNWFKGVSAARLCL